MTHTLTPREVADSLGVSARTVDAWIASGELRSVNLSRSRTSAKPRRRVLESDLHAFLAGRANDAERPQIRRRRAVQSVEIEQFV